VPARHHQYPPARPAAAPASSISIIIKSHRDDAVKAFIRRAEQADLGRGLSSSYACYNCYPDSFFTGWI